MVVLGAARERGTRPSTPEIERLRQTVAERVRKTSLRAVARNVGMSATGLEKFLAGGVPYSRTREKLLAWSTDSDTVRRRSYESTGEEVLLGALVRDLPAEKRFEATAALVRDLAAIYDGCRAPLPLWMAKLSPWYRA